MPKLRITDTNLKDIVRPAKGKSDLYWDDQLAGFGVRATPSGITFIVQRRINGKDGRTVRDTIGKYGEISATQARRKAAAALAELRTGTDLVKVKKIKRVKDKTQQTTLGEIFDAYMLKKAKKIKKNGEKGLRATTKKLYANLMRLYIRKDLSKNKSDYDLSSLPIADITHSMIEHKLEILANEPGTSEKRPDADRTAQAQQCFRLLRSLFNFAATRYEVDGKPLVNINWIPKVSDDTGLNSSAVRNTIIAETELADWYKAVAALTNPVLKDYLLWVAYSGMRRGEAITLRLADIDFKNKSVRIRPEIAKTGKERILPLTDTLEEIAIRRRNDKNTGSVIAMNRYLFKGAKEGKHLQEPKRGIAAVCKAINKQWSLHDLRRTYITHASRLVPYPVLKKLAGHGNDDVTEEHYLRLDLESLRPEAQKITDWLADKMGMETSLLEVAK